jgi:8-oxo-dGTP pyrophosphatase MutT (NUDIX family)
MLKVDDVEQVLGDSSPRLVENQSELRRAAVSAVFRDGADEAELLFIHRAEHPDDPWSGHMAFPGGRVDPGDETSLAGALREAREELDLDLTRHGRLLGRLSDVRAVARGRRLPLVIEPYVFELRGAPVLTPNHEVATVVWVPLSFLTDHGHRSTMQWRVDNISIPLPCYRYNEHVIWGLTLQMLDELLELLQQGSSFGSQF